MDDGYVIENGEIKLTLSEADLEDVLEDVKDCRDLLEPHIRLIGNTVIFRDQDIKLIDPVTFFVRTQPIFKMPKKYKIQGGIITALLMLYLGALGNDVSLFVTMVNSLMGVILGLMCYYAMYNYLFIEYQKRHRKALYVKAKLLSFFYMVILQELTTTSERLERSSNRLHNDCIELKSMYRKVFTSLPSDVRGKVPDRFPDGEEIHLEKQNYS